MSTQVKRRRGTTAQHLVFTGAEAELTYDQTMKTIRIHDGSQVGGFIALRFDADGITLTLPASGKIVFTSPDSSKTIGLQANNSGELIEVLTS